MSKWCLTPTSGVILTPSRSISGVIVKCCNSLSHIRIHHIQNAYAPLLLLYPPPSVPFTARQSQEVAGLSNHNSTRWCAVTPQKIRFLQISAGISPEIPGYPRRYLQKSNFWWGRMVPNYFVPYGKPLPTDPLECFFCLTYLRNWAPKLKTMASLRYYDVCCTHMTHFLKHSENSKHSKLRECSNVSESAKNHFFEPTGGTFGVFKNVFFEASVPNKRLGF